MNEAIPPPGAPGPVAAPALTGPHLRLRPPVPADAPALLRILRAPSVARWWPIEGEADVEELIAPVDPALLVWCIELDGSVVGVIQAWEETDPSYRHAGLDLALHPEAQGRGLGPEAIHIVARWLFDVRGHHRLTIDPNAANARAIRAYRRVGFRPVGLLRRYEWDAANGRWSDGLLMDLLRDELRARHGHHIRLTGCE